MSQEVIESFRLELARPGPLYGQLLSRLTSYLSLCDGVEADTFQLPFAHYEIEEDLQGLRYLLESPNGAELVPNVFRATCLERLSNRVADTVSQMRGFQTRHAEAAKADLTHLRLLLNGGELSLIPFELATVPSGWRGSGGKLALQSRARTVITRELRDSARYPLLWVRRPRVLFCTASPDGFQPPPAQEHLIALADAFRPWTKDKQRQNTITVLENASIPAITAATRDGEYTHVHLLAHGAPIPKQRERYGIALAQRSNAKQAHVVDAQQLSSALWGSHAHRKPPTMVTLASCDSANQASVVLPGSSFAHELHREGVPWVIGSQMPLTFRGSVVLTRLLYSGLFAGDDPRWVLHRLRNNLAELPDTHDWASLVVYAALPADFDQQAREFAIQQIKRTIRAGFDRAETIKEDRNLNREQQKERCGAEFSEIDRQIVRWEQLLPTSSLRRNDVDRSEYFGMRGSVAKQQAAFLDREEARKQLSQSAQCYRLAASLQLGNHWVIVQYLSLRTLLAAEASDELGPAGHADAPGWREMAEFAAVLDCDDEKNRVWALASLLELALLAPDGKARKKDVRSWALEFARTVDPTSFEYSSTLRQLERYYGTGQFTAFASHELQARAQEAVTAITTFIAHNV